MVSEIFLYKHMDDEIFYLFIRIYNNEMLTLILRLNYNRAGSLKIECCQFFCSIHSCYCLSYTLLCYKDGDSGCHLLECSRCSHFYSCRLTYAIFVIMKSLSVSPISISQIALAMTSLYNNLIKIQLNFGASGCGLGYGCSKFLKIQLWTRKFDSFVH